MWGRVEGNFELSTLASLVRSYCAAVRSGPSAHQVWRWLSLRRCRVERAVRSHSLRAWAIGRAQMAIPSKECTLLHTIYITPGL